MMRLSVCFKSSSFSLANMTEKYVMILVWRMSMLSLSKDQACCLIKCFRQNFKYLSTIGSTSRKVRNDFDVIVVGGGHAGSEASAASCRMGAKTLLITHKKSTLGEMSCNPSFGGIGKGHLMKEVDALDGVCSRICDLSGVHYKVLNRRKGQAVWGYRAQIDRVLYKNEIQNELFNTPNLNVLEASVEDIILHENQESFGDTANSNSLLCCGVVLAEGREIFSSCVVLATGTFLRGSINIGLETQPAGRIGDKPAVGLAKTIEKLNFKMGRLKTGTPPRIVKSSIDFSICKPNLPDDPPRPFSFLNEKVKIKPEDQLLCYLTHTTDGVDKIVRESLHLNRHVREEITGPRYCPSIESKVLRYPTRKHQVWLEPEGLDSPLTYPQGLSCTMPFEYQQQLVRMIPGLEACEIARPGYGVEYDYVNPQELTPELETKKIKGLYFAGQLNGTTGYEEAAAQGIIAGINAAASALNKSGLILDRTEAYIGVLIDDLTTQGVTEPYRMFTSRSEFRFSLRPDNADMRLTEKGYEIGCVSEERYHTCKVLSSKLKHWMDVMKDDKRSYSVWADLFGLYKSPSKNEPKSAFDILGFPSWNLSVEQFGNCDSFYRNVLLETETLRERLKVESIYAFSLILEKNMLDMVRRDYSLSLPTSLDYFSPDLNLSNEIREKFSTVRPTTLGAASLIPGVTPAGVAALLAYVRRKNKKYSNLI